MIKLMMIKHKAARAALKGKEQSEGKQRSAWIKPAHIQTPRRQPSCSSDRACQQEIKYLAIFCVWFISYKLFDSQLVLLSKTSLLTCLPLRKVYFITKRPHGLLNPGTTLPLTGPGGLWVGVGHGEASISHLKSITWEKIHRLEAQGKRHYENQPHKSRVRDKSMSWRRQEKKKKRWAVGTGLLQLKETRYGHTLK